MRACVALVVTILALTAARPHRVSAQNTQPAATLRVGAARVDVTPAQLPRNYTGVLDRLYARAIVLENGATRAALVTVDTGGIQDATWQAVSSQVEKELRIPAAHVLLTATHTHSAGGQGGADYVTKIVESVRAAQKALEPARVGYGSGVSFINVNRQIIDPKTGRWWEGANYDGPSDKTVAVSRKPASLAWAWACSSKSVIKRRRCSLRVRNCVLSKPVCASRSSLPNVDRRRIAAESRARTFTSQALRVGRRRCWSRSAISRLPAALAARTNSFRAATKSAGGST